MAILRGRRSGICLTLGLAAAWLAASCTPEPQLPGPGLLAFTATELAAQLQEGRISAETLTLQALHRIEAIDRTGPALNAIIEISPDALATARELDRRFATEGPTGPLHGLPVVLKANIDTADAMATSAGSIALRDHHATADAEIVTRLRGAGAVIIGKTNLSEWANFRSPGSTSGWSSLGGQTRNPYALDRNPCGSSSGSAVAVAAMLVPLAVGTETNGSIVCPAGANGVVGIKPTLGLISAAGIVPLAPSLDTAGPMARTVADASMLLTTLAGSPPAGGYAATAADLPGLRLGVIRDYAGAGRDPQVEAAFSDWLGLLQDAGANLVDPVIVDAPASASTAMLEVLLHEFAEAIDEYLDDTVTGPESLAELIEFNEIHSDQVMPFFGQEFFLMAAERQTRNESSYQHAVRNSHDAMRERLAGLFDTHDLDALIAPVNSPAWRTDHQRGDAFFLSSSSYAAVSGYPSVAVPGGLVRGLPVAVAFIGRPFSESHLIAIAAAFEQLRDPMPPPAYRRVPRAVH